jgi:UDP-N-acetylmuramyl pentapeptide phosphotransferase/UDP-N-acetylglucosamine-1-phosphate transferase
MMYILLLILLFAAELAYFKIAERYNIIDKPNKRSSHTRVTLRGGGVIFYIGILLYFLLEGLQYPFFFIGLTLITAISFADDLRPQSSRLRLSVHFAAMALMFYQWGLYSEQWYFILVAVVVCIGILNAYNFMDGINGITGLYSMIVVGAFWYINLYTIHFIDDNLIYATLLALVVFNFFNLRTKAKCFAGDVGSISIAFIILFLLGLLVIKTGDFSYIILLVVYGIDSILTIIHRLILKENIFQPHRNHVFQIMANELKIPHVIVSLIYANLQILILIGYFVFKQYSYWYLGIVIVILSFCYLIFKKKYFRLHQSSQVLSTKVILSEPSKLV